MATYSIGPLVGVPDGQHGQEDVVRPDLQRGVRRADLVHVVAVGEHHPLGLAGGPGGVDDRGQLLRLAQVDLPVHEVRLPGEQLPALVQHFPEGQDAHPILAGGVFDESRVHDDQGLQPLERLAHGEDLFQLRLILGQAEGALGVLQDVLDLHGRRIRAARHVGRSDALQGQVGHQPLGHVVGDDADVVAPLDPYAAQAGGEGAHVLVQGLPAHRPEGSGAVLDPLDRQVRPVGGEFPHQLGDRLGHVCSFPKGVLAQPTTTPGGCQSKNIRALHEHARRLVSRRRFGL